MGNVIGLGVWGGRCLQLYGYVLLRVKIWGYVILYNFLSFVVFLHSGFIYGIVLGCLAHVLPFGCVILP
jgi:hypothetical protein